MRLNKKQKARVSKLMNSYLSELGNAILRINTPEIRSKRFFSVNQAYNELVSNASFKWFTNQSYSDLKLLVSMPNISRLHGASSSVSGYFKFIGISFDDHNLIDDKVDEYLKCTGKGWDKLEKFYRDYFLNTLFSCAINGASRYNLTKIRDIVLNYGSGFPLYLTITDPVFKPYFENKLNSNDSFRRRILSIKNKRVFNFSFGKLNDNIVVKEFKHSLFDNPRERILREIRNSPKCSFDFADIIMHEFFTDYYPKNSKKKTLSPNLKYNISKAICEKFLTLDFNSLDFIVLHFYSMSISDYLKYYLLKKSKSEMKDILNNFIEKMKDVEKKFQNNTLFDFEDDRLNKAAESMYDIFYSVKRRVMFCILKTLDKEDFVFYIKEISEREKDYYFKRVELSSWC